MEPQVLRSEQAFRAHMVRAASRQLRSKVWGLFCFVSEAWTRLLTYFAWLWACLLLPTPSAWGWVGGARLGAEGSCGRRRLSPTGLPGLEWGGYTDTLRLREGAPQALRGCDGVRSVWGTGHAQACTTINRASLKNKDDFLITRRWRAGSSKRTPWKDIWKTRCWRTDVTDGTPLMTVPLTRALRELLFFFLILLWHCSLRSVRGWAGPDIWCTNSVLREQVAFEAFFWQCQKMRGIPAERSEDSGSTWWIHAHGFVSQGHNGAITF